MHPCLLTSSPRRPGAAVVEAFEKASPADSPALRRASSFLTHPVFNNPHSEPAMLRYIRALSDKALS